jgi:membrane protease YdiL (CAAX protease family)
VTERQKRYISGLLLVVLLVLRYGDSFLSFFIPNAQINPFLQSMIYISIFLLMLIAMWINKARLNALNLDKIAYMLTLMVSTILGLILTPYIIGVILLIAVGIFIYLGHNQRFHYSKSNLSPVYILPPVMLIFLPFLIYAFFSPTFRINVTSFGAVQTALINVNIFTVIFEEFLFRGLLWDHLSARSLQSGKVIAIQALLFWLAHLPSVIDKWFFFWVTLPFVSVMLGILIYRSKSLTVTIITHSLYNFAVGLL